MITYIRGILEGMEEDQVIVDVGGGGYGIYMAGTAMGRLPARLAMYFFLIFTGCLSIYFHIRMIPDNIR